MKTILNIAQIWYTELLGILKDKGILIFIVFVPLAYPLLYSYVYTNEVVRDVPVAVVNDCDNPMTRDMLRKIDASPDVRIIASCTDMEEAMELIREQKVYGVIRVPSSFSRDISLGDQTHLGVYCDMSSLLYYKAILLTATNVSLDLNKDIKVEHHLPGVTEREDEVVKTPIEYDYVALYNPQSGFAAFLIPPVLMLIIQQTLFLGIGMSMGNSRERYNGSVIPFNKWYKNPVNIVFGKGLPYFFLYVLLAIYMFVVVTDMFTLPRLGHYRTFLCFIVPYLLSCIFMGMVLSAFVYRREDCIMLFVFMSVPMLFLSGLSYPAPSMPAFWKYVSYIFPSTFGMNGYVRISAMGASLQDIRPEYCALWIQTGVYFVMACLYYRSQIVKLSRKGKPSDNDPSPASFEKDGVKYCIGNEYLGLTSFITRVPRHEYEADRVFCNHRNTVERVNIDGRYYVVKRFKRPTWANCFVYTFFRKNKACRAYNHALILESKGINTPRPVAYLTRKRYGLFHTGWFISEYKPYPSLKAAVNSTASPEQKDFLLKEFVEFTCKLHQKGIRHKDYNPGNILVHFPEGSDRPEFTLIDINRMSIGRKPGIRDSVTAFMQNTLRLKEDIMPLVRYYSKLRHLPFILCRHACYRYYFLRGMRRCLKKPVKAVVIAVTR